MYLFKPIKPTIFMKKLKQLIDKARKDKDVLAVSIFGSFARGEKHKDIDICIFLKQKKKYDNSKMTDKRLKYLSDFDFDIHIFQQLPLYIRHRILKEGKILFCENEDNLYDLAYLTAKEYEDFKPIYRSYLEAVKNG